MTPYLPFDYSRCVGKPKEDGFESECVSCLRRLAPWGPRQPVMGTPEESPCTHRIEERK